ncbi:hypothetical protein GCM10017083_21230 [Thalassobaculum fulvum]|uniref:Integral membrane protein n=1 Tax=Thalassobaculum fulvum TaxID=1633335 RepID=A0A918XS15_9PROT|nr:hypothetical protein GCM10017083_21230 [Thalassobaculum fulvum]
MQRVLCLLIGLLIVSAPGLAAAQTDIPPPVVQSLTSPETPTTYRPWIGATAGTTIAVIGVNAWTGGALLAPALGPALSGILGGYWLGMSALTPLSAQGVFQTTSLIAVGVAGGVFGHWLGSR